MHIGIDFDNTIVNHDAVFYKYALAENLIAPEVQRSKHHIGHAIRNLAEGNRKWTTLQGKVYGKYIFESKPMHGVKSFLLECLKKSIVVSVVSHRTQFPVIGSRVDLRQASLSWLESQNFFSRYGLSTDRVYFADTIDEKIRIIDESNFDYFIDDLDIILTHQKFPKQTEKIYFGKHKRLKPEDIAHFQSWQAIRDYIFKNIR